MRHWRRVALLLALVLGLTALFTRYALDDLIASRIHAALTESLEPTGTRVAFDNLHLALFTRTPNVRLDSLRIMQGDTARSDDALLEARLDGLQASLSWRALLTGDPYFERLDVQSLDVLLMLPRRGDMPVPANARPTTLPVAEVVQRVFTDDTLTLLRGHLHDAPTRLGELSIGEVHVQIDRTDNPGPAMLDAVGTVGSTRNDDLPRLSLRLDGIAQSETMQWLALAEDGRFELTLDAWPSGDAIPGVDLTLALQGDAHSLAVHAAARAHPSWQDSTLHGELTLTDAQGEIVTASLQQTGNHIVLSIPQSPRHRSDLLLEGSVATDADRLHVDARLSAETIHLDELLATLNTGLPDTPVDNSKNDIDNDNDNDSTTVTDSVPLRPPAMLTATLDLAIDTLVYRHLQATAIAGRLDLSPTSVHVELQSDDVADGSALFTLAHDQASTTAGGTARGTLYVGVQNLRIDPVLSLFAEERLLSGRVTSEWEFGADGTTLAQLRESLFGEGYLLIEEGQVDSMAVELAGIDLQESLALLFRKDSRQYPIECGYLDVSAEAGRLQIEQFLFDTGDTWFQATGYADLPGDRIDITLTPRPKDTSYLSLTSSLHVRGTLSSPTIRPGRKLYGKLVAGAALAALVSPVGLVLPMIRLGDGTERQPCQAMQVD